MNRSLLIIAASSILLTGCASTRPLVQYDAVPGPKINAFYIDGVSIASCPTDSCFFSLAIDQQAIVGGYGHLRVWFLYENTSSAPFLLRPWTILRMEIIDSVTGERYAVSAATPNELLTKIDKQEASEAALAFLGGVTRSLEAANSNMTPREQLRAQSTNVVAAAADIASTQQWYSIVRSSTTSGLLQKNTVDPGQSVNGYVYFPLKTQRRTFTNLLFGSRRWKCAITATTPTGDQEVMFVPVDKE